VFSFLFSPLCALCVVLPPILSLCLQASTLALWSAAVCTCGSCATQRSSGERVRECVCANRNSKARAKAPPTCSVHFLHFPPSLPPHPPTHSQTSKAAFCHLAPALFLISQPAQAEGELHASSTGHHPLLALTPRPPTRTQSTQLVSRAPSHTHPPSFSPSPLHTHTQRTQTTPLFLPQ
jgi:hypothetical protein